MENKMIYPTEKQLTKDQFNRYELVIGVAKCARIVTDEYIEMRAKAQKMIDDHETKKAVKIAIAKLESGRFKLCHPKNV